MSRLLLLALALCLLVACGFQPRGALQVPPDVGPLRVDSRDPYNPVAAGLSRALQRATCWPHRARPGHRHPAPGR
ncbi:hypothetical protein [Alkalisalibacterium limincola]|uniref:Uncharacterized protein n=1 Tax=Alkalisalibacterium limincola TaxID=2699169 RepID=A0A5C8KMR8_9GAMM|nr:hypothetical protein [Alkalisalibacterium limincola]TXK60495.1 hypothetical protein FU658_11920 [Alkalisalibacterium limincola]